MAELDADRLREAIPDDVDSVMEIAAEVRLDAVVTPDDVSRIIHRLLRAVPASTVASTLLATAVDALHDGPEEPVILADVVAREHVEALVDGVVGLHPALADALDELTESPLVGALASRFITRLVTDVLQANRAVAEKIPGMGSIMSFGTSAASRVISAADRPLQMVGDTANKGAAIAVRRLNAVVIDTLRDPLLRAAAMEVWDTQGTRPLRSPSASVSRDQVQDVAGVLQEIVIGAAPSAPLSRFVDTVVESFLGIYGPYPVATLIEDMGVSRDDVAAEAQALLPGMIAAARDDGRLEQVVRDRLAPFFASPEVTAILAR